MFFVSQISSTFQPTRFSAAKKNVFLWSHSFKVERHRLLMTTHCIMSAYSFQIHIRKIRSQLKFAEYFISGKQAYVSIYWISFYINNPPDTNLIQFQSNNFSNLDYLMQIDFNSKNCFELMLFFIAHCIWASILLFGTVRWISSIGMHADREKINENWNSLLEEFIGFYLSFECIYFSNFPSILSEINDITQNVSFIIFR